MEFEVTALPLHLQFSVTDHGIGIPAAEVHQLFESFFRASNVEEIVGTGLGLAIVKRAIDLHGGTIQVISELGHGSRFVVLLPIAR